MGVGSTGLKTGFGDGFGAAVIAMPLFQTSLLPDLMQVNFLPAEIDVAPAFVHFAPALGVAAWTGVVSAMSKIIDSNKRTFLFMLKAFSLYLRRIRNLDPC